MRVKCFAHGTKHKQQKTATKKEREKQKTTKNEEIEMHERHLRKEKPRQKKEQFFSHFLSFTYHLISFPFFFKSTEILFKNDCGLATLFKT